MFFIRDVFAASKHGLWSYHSGFIWNDQQSSIECCYNTFLLIPSNFPPTKSILICPFRNISVFATKTIGRVARNNPIVWLVNQTPAQSLSQIGTHPNLELIPSSSSSSRHRHRRDHTPKPCNHSVVQPFLHFQVQPHDANWFYRRYRWPGWVRKEASGFEDACNEINQFRLRDPSLSGEWWNQKLAEYSICTV